MRKSIIAALIALSSTSALAAETIYDGRGNIYLTNATLADLQSEATRLNTYTNGNSVAIKVLADKADVTNQRVDAVAIQANANSQNIKNLNGKTTKNTAAIADHETRINYNTNQVNAVQSATKSLQARADDADLALIGVQQVNQSQDIRLAGHDTALARQDQINEALSTSVAGLYTDMSGLRGEVRQARREAKQARAGAAAALAVAGHQFDTKGGFQTAVSVANMGGYSALAIGAGGAVSDRVFINAGLTTSSNQTGAVLSGTYSW